MLFNFSLINPEKYNCLLLMVSVDSVRRQHKFGSHSLVQGCEVCEGSEVSVERVTGAIRPVACESNCVGHKCSSSSSRKQQ